MPPQPHYHLTLASASTTARVSALASSPSVRSSLSMSHDAPVARRRVEILNALGLHMRPADKFVRLAIKYASDVKVHYNGSEFNGKSILDLTLLGAEKGTHLEVEARGPDADAAVAALADLILAGFFEDDGGQEIPQETKPTQDPAP